MNVHIQIVLILIASYGFFVTVCYCLLLFVTVCFGMKNDVTQIVPRLV